MKKIYGVFRFTYIVDGRCKQNCISRVHWNQLGEYVEELDEARCICDDEPEGYYGFNATFCFDPRNGITLIELRGAVCNNYGISVQFNQDVYDDIATRMSRVYGVFVADVSKC